MATELTNLVPAANTKSFRRLYFVRLGTIVVFMFAVVVGIQVVLLVPSYIYERESLNTASARLAQVSAAAASGQGAQVQSQLKALQGEAAYLQALDTTPTASAAITAILQVPRPGITLGSFTFTPPNNGALGSLQIAGVASTRETLRSYDAALSSLSFIKSADLPISDYAKESNISFTIALTGNFTP